MLDSLKALIIAVPLALAAGYIYGCSSERAKNTLEWEVYKASLEQQNQSVEQINQIKTQAIENGINDAVESAEKHRQTLESRYEALSNDNFIVRDVSRIGRVLTDPDASSGEQPVSDVAGNSSGAEDCQKCQCYAENKAKLRELYQRQLDLARLHEECELKLDSVIDFYEKARKAMEP